jgi:hypothetical protein
MCAIFAAIKTNGCDPFVNKSCGLPGAEVAHVVHSAREEEIVDRGATALQPCLKALTCLRHDLELNRPASLSLVSRRALTDLAAADDVTNPELNEVTATQLERAFGPHTFTCVSRATLVNSRVKVRMSHDTSPMAGVADQRLGLLSCDGLTPPTKEPFNRSDCFPESRPSFMRSRASRLGLFADCPIFDVDYLELTFRSCYEAAEKNHAGGVRDLPH